MGVGVSVSVGKTGIGVVVGGWGGTCVAAGRVAAGAGGRVLTTVGVEVGIAVDVGLIVEVGIWVGVSVGVPVGVADGIWVGVSVAGNSTVAVWETTEVDREAEAVTASVAMTVGGVGGSATTARVGVVIPVGVGAALMARRRGADVDSTFSSPSRVFAEIV